MVQQLKMLNWFLITLSFMLKTAVKCLFSIAIAVVLYVKKTVWRFSCHIPKSKLEHNAQNDRNVTKLRDHCGAFKNGFLIKKYYLSEDTLRQIKREKQLTFFCSNIC